MTQTTTPTVSNPLPRFLDLVEIGPSRSVRTLTVWPLRLNRPTASKPNLAYVPLSEAMAMGLAHVEELNAHGAVPNIRVQNQADVALLVLFGEEILGAKQNRIANASFLVAAHSDTVIDVSCVEAGRWGHSDRRGTAARFHGADSLLSQSIRRTMHRQVHRSRSAGQGFRADQSQVWSEVAKKLADSGVSSPSLAYSDYRRHNELELRDVRSALRPAADQGGFVAAIDDEIVGVEAVGRAEVFNSYFDRLIDAYAVDALDAERLHGRGETDGAPGSAGRARRGPRSRKRPGEFLDLLRHAKIDAAASLGLGEDLRLTSAQVEGCALVAGELVHLTAAPALA